MNKPNGGYQIIDCDGLNLLGGSTPQTKTGLYKKLQSALKSNKPVYAYNCIYGEGHPMTPVQVMCQQEDANTIVATASILQIWVTKSDSVTIASLVG